MEQGANIVSPEECTMQECSEKCQIVITSEFRHILCLTSATKFKYTTESSNIQSQLKCLTRRIESLEQQHHTIEKQFSQTDQDKLLEKLQSDLTTYKEEVAVLQAKFENMSVPVLQEKIDTLANSLEYKGILHDKSTRKTSSFKRTNRTSYGGQRSRPRSDSFEAFHRSNSVTSSVSSGYQSNADTECYQDDSELQDLTAIQELESNSDKENIHSEEDPPLLTSTPYPQTDDQNGKNELEQVLVIETLLLMSKLVSMLRKHTPQF